MLKRFVLLLPSIWIVDLAMADLCDYSFGE